MKYKKIFKEQVHSSSSRLQNLFWSKKPNVKLTHTVFFVGPQSFSLSHSFTLTLSLSFYLSLLPQGTIFPLESRISSSVIASSHRSVNWHRVFFTAEATELTDPLNHKNNIRKKMENRDPPTATHRD